MKKRKNNFAKFFILSWKKTAIALMIWIISVVAHNFWYGLFGFEDALFFIIAVIVIPIYFLVSIVYTLIKKVKGQK